MERQRGDHYGGSSEVWGEQRVDMEVGIPGVRVRQELSAAENLTWSQRTVTTGHAARQ